MATVFDYKPGSLVTFRNRPWVVLPSEDPELMLLKPLGGSDEEITGIYLPLLDMHHELRHYDFDKPSANDLGNFSSAKLLYNAARLTFRNAAGPFRCLGKISFRPRPYQMVPLIMALKQHTTRLLIADDVGVGKTIEALLIAKELYERREINSFAVVCPPHLCDQWQDELKDKFGIEAVIIRSGTASSLERQIKTHENIFRAFPFQVISIDYIKSGNKLQVFVDHCPKLIIVDEVHTCARPAGANDSQQQRYHLLHLIAKKPNQHLVLLTATPHSGKQEEFQSLLGLLNPEFENMDLLHSSQKERKKIAGYFIQRRRGDVQNWLDEETRFPVRISIERDYEISENYAAVFDDILEYAREIVRKNHSNTHSQRYAYWEALALLRGVMSSPAAGISMLTKKAQKKMITDEDDDPHNAPEQADVAESVMDNDFASDDNLPLSALGKKGKVVQDSEAKRLLEYACRLKDLCGIEHDHKAKEALAQIKNFLERGYNPIVFCRYIQTANYLGKIFKNNLTGRNFKNLHIEVVTSELNDELRREKIAEMNKSERRLLIATDCLSEGINLQESFNALLHYDLPWNPNRLEQREGRIDRFGQLAETVEVALLYGNNNPVDGAVLDVLLRKARDIKASLGISVPFPENSTTVMEAVAKAILLKSSILTKQVHRQRSLFEDEDIENEKKRVAIAYDEARQKEEALRSIFAQNTINPREIEADLREVDEAIGDVKAVEQFVVDALRFMGVQVDAIKDGYKLYTTNIPERLRLLLTDSTQIQVSFKSPTPAGFKYIGRNHPFTQHLAQYIINSAFQRDQGCAARAAVLRCAEVNQKTVLFLFRVRNVIAEQATGKYIVAEEMWLWGYVGDVSESHFLDKDTAMHLLMNAKPVQNIEDEEKAYWLKEEMAWVLDEKTFRTITDPVAWQRGRHLVECHTRFKNLVNGNSYTVVEPVLPMDVLGIYIFLPQISE
ncbi:helicase-related protein [Schleiferia thermophila]|nr:helicase-related protein [Schleiferia thermophila]